MRILVVPDADGEFGIEITNEELELARARAFRLIAMLDGSPVIGDRVRTAYELHHGPEYFMDRRVAWSGYSRRWIEEFFGDSTIEVVEIERTKS